jgi:undecaprenyl-diphosphatase
MNFNLDLFHASPIFKSFFLGIVQGLTEFLPVSSTAHLRIVPSLLHWGDPGTAFSAVIQLGTALSVIIYFWKDLLKIYGMLVANLFSSLLRKDSFLSSYESRIGFWIILGTIPICIFGLLFKEPIETGMVRNLNLISFFLIFIGILLVVGEIIAKQNKTLDRINFADVLFIGLAQSLALIPGVSRSGITILAGLLVGFKRSDAARFSFLLSVPAILASGILELRTLLNVMGGITQSSYINLFIGIFTAFVSGYFAIHFLLKYLQSHKTYIFVVYRILLGVLVLYLTYKGFIN